MKYRYEEDPSEDPNRDANWMFRGTYHDPSIQFLNDVNKLRWDPNTRSYRAGYVQDGQWNWGSPAGFSFAGGAGTASAPAAPSVGVGGTAGTAGAASTAGGAAAAPSVGAGAAGGGVGGGTMASSAISAGGQIGSSALAGKGAKEAARIQAQSAREALQFAREQEGAAQGRYGQSKEQYDKQVADWYAARNALLSRYGVDINLGSGGIPPGGFPPLPNSFVPQEGQNVVNIGGPARTPAPERHPSPSSPSQQGATLGDLATNNPAWNDWARYNLGVK